MTVFKRAVTGFNHNVRHRGEGYHIQTEDSGISNPHIITHLFQGGTIIASKKTSYQDILGAENLQEIVRELMEEQHREMLRSLLSGAFDKKPTSPTAPDTSALNAPPSPPEPGALPQGKPLPQPAAAATAQAAPAPARLFGQDLISDKSLDEVILAYLAATSD